MFANATFETSKKIPEIGGDEPRVLREGRLIFSRYRLERMLGRGGMGVVWLAQDSKLDRAVALKFLPELFIHDPVSRDELKSETRRSLQLTHPNIMRIYDFVEDSEAAAISMEYVDGATLSHLRVQRLQRCFEAEGLQAWVADLCRALDYAHQHARVVHRDLKPANLMVNSRGSLKVADFGISCGLHNTAARVSAWNSSGGTLGYMSPQQLEGELASVSDDIYSIGATLYELLTSKPPFYSGDVSLQIRSVVPEKMAERRRKLGLAGEAIPASWEQTVAACLSKNSSERPASAGEMARLLGVEIEQTAPNLTADAPTFVPRIAIPQPKSTAAVVQKLARNPVVSVACAAAAALVAFTLWPRSHPASLVGGTDLRSKPHPAAAPLQSSAANASTAPAIGSGGLMLKTSPPGAAVSVDGHSAGTTPISVPDLREGVHAVGINMPGFEPTSIQAQVRRNQFNDLGLVVMQRSLGTLQITSQPEGSEYVLLSADGGSEIRRGQTPDSISRLPTGQYRLRASRLGWPAQEQLIAVERESACIASCRFGTGALEVTTDPPGAEILDGQRILGVTPLNVRIPSGPHSAVTAKLEGFQDRSFSVDIAPDQTAALPPVVLQPLPPSVSIVTNPPGVPFQVFSGAFETPNPEPVGKGETPASIEGLSPGAYRMVLGGNGWPLRSVTFQAGVRGVTALTQDFPHGTVAVESQPPGADVYEGDFFLGTTPATFAISPGSHAFVAEIEGRRPLSHTVAVAADEFKTVHFEIRAASSGGGEGTASHHKHRPRPPLDQSELTKIGRTIKTFFFGKPASKKPAASGS